MTDDVTNMRSPEYQYVVRLTAAWTATPPAESAILSCSHTELTASLRHRRGKDRSLCLNFYQGAKHTEPCTAVSFSRTVGSYTKNKYCSTTKYEVHQPWLGMLEGTGCHVCIWRYIAFLILKLPVSHPYPGPSTHQAPPYGRTAPPPIS